VVLDLGHRQRAAQIAGGIAGQTGSRHSFRPDGMIRRNSPPASPSGGVDGKPIVP
jgi:hypothetical protein